MMSEIAAMALCLTALSMGIGVFVLPDDKRSVQCFLGLSAALALFLVVAESSSVAWALLLCGASLAVTSTAARGDTRRDGGWQNWFVIVVTASTLWLLSLFLLWTLEEALVLPIDAEGLPPTVSEVLAVCFDHYLWPIGLVALLAAAVAVSADTSEAEVQA